MKSIKKLLKKSGHSILDEENYLVEKSQQFFEELEHLNIAEKEIEESEGDYNYSSLLVFDIVPTTLYCLKRSITPLNNV